MDDLKQFEEQLREMIGITMVLPKFRPTERIYKSRISSQCEPDSSLG